MAPHGNSKQKMYGTDAVTFYTFVVTSDTDGFCWLWD